MSESATSYRPLGAEEFDRRMRSIQAAPAPAAHGEALAELARLVGEHDPFAGRDPFAPDPFASMAPARVSAAAPLPGPADAGEEAGAPDNPAVVHGGVSHPNGWERAVPRFPSITPRDQRPVEPSPDMWARGVEAGASGEPSLTAEREPAVAAATSTGNSRRTVVVLAAVLALTGGGLAASFLAKPSGSSVAGGSGGTPTILAATGPSKVKPATPATGDGAPSEPSTLLDKNNNDGTAAAKVVNTVEQPVDLNQAIKPSAAAANDTSASPFPEPRKVRTVVVRPDGSIIGEAPATDPAADAPLPSTASQQASLAFDPKTALPIVNNVPAAATPAADTPAPAAVDTVTTTKSTARATARPVASTSQDGSAAAQARTPAATPNGRAKPVAVASAPEADTAAPAEEAAPAGNGKFAVQLGAAPSEAEGKQAASRLGAKFAGDLGGSRPGVVKAEAGGKTVYRIRVGNLSQEDAKSICGRIKAAGGGCFVAKN